MSDNHSTSIFSWVGLFFGLFFFVLGLGVGIGYFPGSNLSDESRIVELTAELDNLSADYRELAGRLEQQKRINIETGENYRLLELELEREKEFRDRANSYYRELSKYNFESTTAIDRLEELLEQLERFLQSVFADE